MCSWLSLSVHLFSFRWSVPLSPVPISRWYVSGFSSLIPCVILLFLVCSLFCFCSWISGVLFYLPFVSSTSGIWILRIWFFTKRSLFVQSLVCLHVLCFDPLFVKQHCTEYSQEPIAKCLKPAFFLMASRGQLHWLQKKLMVCKPTRKIALLLT